MRLAPRFLVVTSLALLASGALQAQVPKIRSATSTAPSASTQAATAAPKPSGLRAPFPAGIATGSGAAVSNDPVASGAATTTPDAVGASNTAAANFGRGMPTATDTTAGIVDSGAVNTSVLGGPPAYGMARGPAQNVGRGSGGFSAVDIARSFLGADVNGDGELSRTETARLSIMLSTFEEMDRNYDGVISRSEYEDGLR